MKTIYDTIRELVDLSAFGEGLVLSLYLDISKGQAESALSFAKENCAVLLDEQMEVFERSAEQGSVGSRTNATSEDAGRTEVYEHSAQRGNERASTRAMSEDAERMEVAQQEHFSLQVRAMLETLEGEIERASAEEYQGLAVFLCDSPSTRQIIRLRFPFQNQAQLGRDPFLRQLLFYAEEYERACCVTATDSGLVVCEVHIGDLGRSLRLTPTHGRSLGEELSSFLLRLLRESPGIHFIFLGAPSHWAPFEEELSSSIRERVLERVEAPLLPEDPQLLPTIHKILQAYERRTEAHRVTELVSSPREKAIVALGLDETLLALNKGLVDILYIAQDFHEEGWLCDACGYLGKLPVPPVCLVCGATVCRVFLEEHLLDQAALLGAELETVKQSESLAQYGGIGARLHSNQSRS